MADESIVRRPQACDRRTFLLGGLASPALLQPFTYGAGGVEVGPKPLIVFIPGIMGSVLRHGTQDVFPREAYQLYKVLIGKPNHLRYTGRPAQDTAILDYIERWPWWSAAVSPAAAFFRKQVVYERIVKWLGKLAAAQGGTLLTFSYDWRQDLFVTLGELAKALPADRDVYLVGHSMGGVLSALAMIEHVVDPNNLKKLVLIAPPLSGAPKAFRTTMDATQFPVLKEFYAFFWYPNYKAAWQNLHEAIRTFPSVFQLMPPPKNNRAADDGYVYVESIRKWVNPWSRGVFPPEMLAAADRLHSTLERGFQNFPLGKDRVHLLYGSELETDTQYWVEEYSDAAQHKHFELRDVKTRPVGDATVPESSAVSFVNAANPYPFTAAEHVALCGRSDVLNLISLLFQMGP